MTSIVIFLVGAFALVYFVNRYRKTEEITQKRKYGRNAFIGLVLVLGEVYFKIVEAFPDVKFLALIIAIGILLKATELFRGKRK